MYWSPSRPGPAVNWERVIDEEGSVVHASLRENALELNLAPAISVFSQHHGKRITASVYFEIAAKYAEKVGGTVVQRATVAGCKEHGQPQELVLAEYPAMPISMDRVCPGFRAVLQEATHGLDIDDTVYGHPLHRHDDNESDLERPVASASPLWQPGVTAPEAHTCPECGASFPTSAQLLTHIATAHRPGA